MNKKLPYEQKIEDRLADLSLPDEDMAWEDMRKRLEEDDDGGIIPVWLRGCGLWSLLGVVILAVGWWIIRPEKWWNEKQQTENISSSYEKESKSKPKNINPHDTSNTTSRIIK